MDLYAGDVDALVGGQGAAVFHGTVDVLALNTVHLQGHQAVVNEDLLAGAHLLVEIGVGDGDQPGIARRLPGGQGEGGARLQGNRFGIKALDADLRALGVQNGGHRTAHGVPDVVQLVQALQMLLVVAVGKVEARRVHAGTDQLADQFLVVYRGAQGANHFCFSQSHIILPPTGI